MENVQAQDDTLLENSKKKKKKKKKPDTFQAHTFVSFSHEAKKLVTFDCHLRANHPLGYSVIFYFTSFSPSKSNSP